MAASTAQQAQAPGGRPAAEVVGNAFVQQYYLVLHRSPELVHQFYQDVSKLGCLEENGLMNITTTMQAINEKILSLGFAKSAEITSVDAQDSCNDGVLVLVTGYMTANDSVKRKFIQTFFLAPQDKGYFVLNDVLRYVEDIQPMKDNQDSENGKETPLNSDVQAQDPPPVPENNSVEHGSNSEEVNGEEVYNPPEIVNGSTAIEEVPVPEVVDESPNESQAVVEPNSNVEEAPKKSYASIVKVMKEASSSSFKAPPIRRSVVKSHEQHVTTKPTPAPADENLGATSTVVENGINNDGEVDGHSIYIKGLPINATPALLEAEFKKFGPIKNDCIQVRSQRGFCFGFVEFEEASSMQNAIEASPIIIGGRQVIIEPKKSTNRGYSRGRFSSGRGAGGRYEGSRGRGNYGSGRGYARAEFDSKNEFGNRTGRGGFSNRGGDRYQRVDNLGSGSRVNRSVGVTGSVATRTTAPGVTARA